MQGNDAILRRCPGDGVAVDQTENSTEGYCTIRATHCAERILSQQTLEEIVEIDENVVVLSVEFARKELKSTVLRGPEDECEYPG
jgi:hypothetical protein